MKKILTMGIVALVLITMSSCQFNLFAAFDKIEIPSVAELESEASNNPAGFVSDVEDYIENNFLENDDVTDAQVNAIVSSLDTIYSNEGATETGQQAATLAGEIIIDSDPDTKYVVDNIVSSVTEALESGSTDPEVIISGVFPPSMSQLEFAAILVNLSDASDAYKDFATSIDVDDNGSADPDSADWMSSGEAGDMVQYAVISIIITDIRASVPELELYNFIKDGTAITTGYTDPFSTNALSALLDFANLGL